LGTQPRGGIVCDIQENLSREFASLDLRVLLRAKRPRPQGTPKKDSCPTCLVKDFAGQVLPDFELPLVGGGKLKLSNLRGKAVLLNLWCRCGANETGPSKAEIPTLVELQNEYGAEGFQVIGVSLDDYASTEEISDYVREMNVNYPIVIGNTSSFEKHYGGIFFLPMTFFLDREGKVVAREIGVQGRKVYVEHIRRSLHLDPAAQSQR
jgi:peroxiredoxin